MTPRLKGIGATAAVTITVVVLVMAAVGLVLLAPPSRPQATAQTSATGSIASSSTPVNFPVSVVTLTGPIPPYPIGEFQVIILLMNAGNTPITSLNATLEWVPPPGAAQVEAAQYSFAFNVTASALFLPGQSIQTRNAFVGPDLGSGLHYPLTISGTLLNQTRFSYTESVLFVRFDL